MTSLHVRALQHKYQDLPVLCGVDFTVQPGQVVSLLGPSGCGKSTCLRLLAGLEMPTGGHIFLGNRCLSAPGWARPPEQRNLNMVFQDYALWPHMKVRDIVGFGLRWRSEWSRTRREQRITALLDMLSISALREHYPSQLSGGQQQRVAIARALATDPAILLFDEPLSNLDVQLRDTMRHELADLFRRVNTAIVYVTHDPLEACSLADEMLVLRDGVIQQSGPPVSVFQEPGSPWVAAMAGYTSIASATQDARLDNHRIRAWLGDQLLVARVPPQSLPTVPGGAVTLCIDPTAANVVGRVSDAGVASKSRINRVIGVAYGCLYEGRYWRVRLQLPGDAALNLTVPEPVERGTRLTVDLDADRVLAFPQNAVSENAEEPAPMAVAAGAAGQ